MITVNLKPGAQRDNDGKRGVLGSLRERMASPASSSKAGDGQGGPWPMIAGAAWLLVLLGLGGVYWNSSRQLNALEPQLEEARGELARYQGFIREKDRQTAIRDSILSQIATIRSVDRDRYIWPHILDEIANALPDYTWLTEVSALPGQQGQVLDSTLVQPVTFRIVGLTGDLQNYTAFQRQLEASPWLTNILPVEAKVQVDKNRALFTFTIQASFAPADSAHVRTVPILESVVR